MCPRLSVVIPIHNEINNLAPLLSEIRTALDGRAEYEIICVDDGSDDGTAERLAALQPVSPGLRVVRLRCHTGQSAAIVTGVRAARGAWIATLDGDGQDDPADLSRMLPFVHDPAASPALGLVVGHRLRRRDSVVKRLASRIANGVRARVLKDATPDTGCGLKLFKREAFVALPQFDHMHRFLPALFLRSGWQVTSAPVQNRPRLYGRSHYGVLDRLGAGLVDLLGVLWLSRRSLRPVVAETCDDD
jgi:glycosyltransferase involved in cell wall biosynthesis